MLGCFTSVKTLESFSKIWYTDDKKWEEKALKQKFSVDRIENSIAICYDEKQQKYEFPIHIVSLEKGSLFEAELHDGLPQNIVALPQQTANQKKQLKRRLDRLFRRNPK